MTNQTQLYPLKFKPILKEKVWGGSKLAQVLGKESGSTCGESWELSAVEGDCSIVSNGQLAGLSIEDVIKIYGEQLLGTNVVSIYGSEFPLLIKFIDANADLSIQVHPNDEQSGGNGKTEMWYVLQADEGASLLSGFKQEVSKEVLRKAVKDASFDKYMNRVEVKAGDSFLIKANQVHTIGKGILLAEIQQTSDMTYRIYDFKRQDARGNHRELHIDQAFEVMNISQDTGQITVPHGNQVNLVSCSEFVTNKIYCDHETSVGTSPESFKILMNIRGMGTLIYDENELSFNLGETVLIPADYSVKIKPDNKLEFLEIGIS